MNDYLYDAIGGFLLLGASLTWIGQYYLKKIYYLKKQHLTLQSRRDKFLLNQIAQIRRPLHGLVGTQDVYQFDFQDDQTKEYMDIVNHCTKNVIDLIDRLQFFTEISSGRYRAQKSQFSVTTAVEKVLESVDRAHPGRQLNIKINVEKKLNDQIQGSRDLFYALMSELMSNAIKYSSDKSCVMSIRTTNDTRYPIELSISDQGPGLHPSVLSKLSLGTKGDQSIYNLGEKSGLGLAMVMEICRLTNSEINVWTGTGSGTIVTVKLSQALAGPVESATGRPGPKPKLAPSNQVLIVDDEALARNLVAGILQRMGYETTICSSGTAAVELCRQHNFGLIIMDIEMPKMDGWETTSKIWNQYLDQQKPLPIIVGLTATISSRSKQKSLDLGFDEFLGKPLCAEDLQIILEKYGVNPRPTKPPRSSDTASLTYEDPNAGYAIDLNKLYHHFGEDMALCQMLLKEAAEELPYVFHQTLDAHQAQNFTELSQGLHKLKGQFAVLMAEKGVDLITKMEGRSNPQSIEYLSDLEDLTKYVESIILEISLLSQEQYLVA